MARLGCRTAKDHDPLTNPTAHGASASDAFDVVIPSMPGYGFSGRPTTTGWDAPHIARAWVVLMKRLGYTQFVAISGKAARNLPEALIGQDIAQKGDAVVGDARAPCRYGMR
jgi:hypothetical protein